MKNIYLSREVESVTESIGERAVLFPKAKIFFTHFRDDCGDTGLSADMIFCLHGSKRIFSLYFCNVRCIDAVMCEDRGRISLPWLSQAVDICVSALEEESEVLYVEISDSDKDMECMRFICSGVLDESTYEYRSYYENNRIY